MEPSLIYNNVEKPPEQLADPSHFAIVPGLRHEHPYKPAEAAHNRERHRLRLQSLGALFQASPHKPEQFGQQPQNQRPVGDAQQDGSGPAVLQPD